MIEQFYNCAISIQRYPRTSDGKGGASQGTATTVWSGNATINPVRALVGIYQKRRGAETTHMIYMPLPTETAEMPHIDDEAIYGERVFRVLSVVQPMTMTLADSPAVHLEIETVEVDIR